MLNSWYEALCLCFFSRLDPKIMTKHLNFCLMCPEDNASDVMWFIHMHLKLSGAATEARRGDKALCHFLSFLRALPVWPWGIFSTVFFPSKLVSFLFVFQLWRIFLIHYRMTEFKYFGINIIKHPNIDEQQQSIVIIHTFAFPSSILQIQQG